MQFSLKSFALTTLLLLPSTQGSPTEMAGAPLEKRGCSRSNSGTHCRGGYPINYDDAHSALRDLLSQCNNGNFAGGAKRVTSDKFNGVVAYACNGFCRSSYMPWQDAEWSINRVLNSCYNNNPNNPNEGWDSQETRGTWYGLAKDADNPCGYPWNHRGADF